ncbi:NADH-quinone oxidoreductase subunit M, partial [Pedococcus sp.]|uniref:NADH-quinone oxidoreductase subunit M n=1 Tax=Pedococcus sp. TaxID=2860345 RepID=UPI002E0E8485|nr:NADH-quinone oxidoreductase subunit M [Pedococcus sp.]
MTSFPWLTVVGLVPLIGAAVVAALPAGLAGRAKHIALGASLLTLVLGVAAALQFTPGSHAQFQLTEQHEWIPQFGVSYALGVDGIALVMILMAVILAPVCILAAWEDVPEGGAREKNYFALMLVLETFMVGVFAATDVFLFYVFFEAMLIPVYFLIGAYGGPRRQYAAVKFLLFSLAGGLVMLVGVIALYHYGPGGHDGFLVSKLTGLSIGTVPQRLMFVAFFFAFAVKAPMWPVHTWLPDAATEARPATAVLLVGVLDKVGTFGFLRYCLGLFPHASHWFTPVVLTLAVVGVIYGALQAIGQKDMLRLVAYTSVSHFGLITLGVFAFTSQGQAGATLYMVNHGFSTGALLLVIGFMIARRKSRGINDFGGMQKVAPILAGTFLIACLSGLALPGLNTFVSEFLVLVGSFTRYKVAASIGTVGIILAALYMLILYQRTMTGPVSPDVEGSRDLSLREKWVIAPVVA